MYLMCTHTYIYIHKHKHLGSDPSVREEQSRIDDVWNVTIFQ